MKTSWNKDTLKWNFAFDISDNDLIDGFLTREKFQELLAKDLASGGYELRKIDFSDTGTYFIIKQPNGLCQLVFNGVVPERINIKGESLTSRSKNFGFGTYFGLEK